MRERLTAIFNTLKEIETKGDSTLMMADCLRELTNVINSMLVEQHESEVAE